MQRMRDVLHTFLKLIGVKICKFSKQPFTEVESLGQPNGFPIIGFMIPNTSYCDIQVIDDSPIKVATDIPDIIQKMSVVKLNRMEMTPESLGINLDGNKKKKSKSVRKKAKKKMNKRAGDLLQNLQKQASLHIEAIEEINSAILHQANDTEFKN